MYMLVAKNKKNRKLIVGKLKVTAEIADHLLRLRKITKNQLIILKLYLKQIGAESQFLSIDEFIKKINKTEVEIHLKV